MELQDFHIFLKFIATPFGAAAKYAQNVPATLLVYSWSHVLANGGGNSDLMNFG